MSERTILVAGGGTAGHVFPSIAVARELQRLAPDVRPVFVGTRDRLEGTLVPDAGFPLHHIDVLPLPRRLSFGLIRVPFALRASVRRCVEIASDEGAVAAVTFGGYVSFPVAWAAARLDLPLVLHEQNAVPGLANRFAARWADRIAVTFPGSADRVGHPEKAVVTGNPVREEILAVEASAREEARTHFGLRPDLPTLLVFGGSQGARSLNQAVVGTCGRWSDPSALQILHAAGSNLHAEAAAAWEQARTRAGAGPLVRCVDFIDDMAAAYAAADVVMCRSGATSIAELTALGLPAVLVPYPHATRDHQLLNGRALEQAGGAVVIEDAELSSARLVGVLQPWLSDPDVRDAVAAGSRAFGRRDAATNVARLVLDLTPVGRSGP